MAINLINEIKYTLGYGRHFGGVMGVKKTLEMMNECYKEDTGERKNLIKIPPFFNYIEERYGSKNY